MCPDACARVTVKIGIRHLGALCALALAACAALPGPPSDREIEHAYVMALAEIPSAQYQLDIAGEPASLAFRHTLRELGHNVVARRTSDQYRNVYLKWANQRRLVVVVNVSQWQFAADYTVSFERLGAGRLKVLSCKVVELET